MGDPAPSKLLQPEQAAVVDGPAQAVLAAALGCLRDANPADFEASGHESQIAGALCMAVQSLLRAAATHAPDMDFRDIMHAVGTGLGAQMTTVSDDDLWRLLERMGQGVAIGRIESTKAVVGLKTEGRC